MLDNFRAIMKYNPAEAYALAIGHLADRLRGDPPFVQAWPRDERVLSSAERYEFQQLLAAHGFDIGGEPNGRINAAHPQGAQELPSGGRPRSGRVRDREPARAPARRTAWRGDNQDASFFPAPLLPWY